MAADPPPTPVMRVREAIVAAARTAGGRVDAIESIFLIGSCADGDVSQERYQDFDIHFRFGPIALRHETLAWLRTLLRSCKGLQDPGCRIEWSLRDRHWKMPPDASTPVNLGLHATLLNAADHWRRVHYNPVLSQNMFVRCAVLFGAHPRELLGFRPAVAADYAHSVGGIGWALENFTRAVALHILEPQDRSFYTFVAGYCWNAVSTVLLHLGTLEDGGIYSRIGAFERLVRDPSVPGPVRQAAELVHARRETGDEALGDARTHFDAAARVLHYVAQRAAPLTGLTAQDLEAPSERPRPFYPASVCGAMGLAGQIFMVEAMVADQADGGDFYHRVALALETSQSGAPAPLSVRESFEMLQVAQRRSVTPCKLRLWNRADLARRMHALDFAYERGQSCLASALFGWEDGAQALLQRLSELYIANDCEEDATLRALSEGAMQLVDERLARCGLRLAKPTRAHGGFPEATAALAPLLEPHVLTVSKTQQVPYRH
jgi:hypothetical protein